MESLRLDELTADAVPTSTGDGWTEYRWSIDLSGVKVPTLVRIREDSTDVLLVTYNGAVQRSKAPDGVVFQRSSWLEDFESSVVQFADPTLVRHERLQIGWGQYDESEMASDTYLKILELLRTTFGLATSVATLHYGSSAGGFQALALGAIDRGSSVLANNPQLDWARYNPMFVKSLLRDVFGGKTVEQIKESQPWRVSLVEFFRHVNNVPDAEIMFNLASSGDLDDQLIPFLNDSSQLPEIGRTPRLKISVYHDVNLGHNPLSKPHTVAAINETLKKLRGDG